MKTLRWILLPLVALGVFLVALVNFRAAPMDEGEPPNRSLVISMPDGSDRTLGEVVDAALVEIDPDPDPEQERAPGGSPTASAGAGTGTAETGPLGGDRSQRTIDDADLIALAEFQIDEGHPEAAVALLRSVPPDHPKYSLAMRRLGWDCYTKGMGEPRRGVAFVNASLRSDPLNGNAWQDTYRVYMRGLGLSVR